MNKLTKVLLTIPSIIGISYLITFIYPAEFHWLIPNMRAYYLQIGVINVLSIVQLFILLRKLWSFNNLEKSVKSDWTWYFLLFNWVATLLFVWKKVDEFEKSNDEKAADIG